MAFPSIDWLLIGRMGGGGGKAAAAAMGPPRLLFAKGVKGDDLARFLLFCGLIGGGGGGAGGGAIKLQATGTLQITSTGFVLANGAGGGGGAGDDNTVRIGGVGGAGAGGGVLLEATELILDVGGPNLSCRGGDDQTVNGGTLKAFYGSLAGALPDAAYCGRIYDAGAGSYP